MTRCDQVGTSEGSTPSRAAPAATLQTADEPWKLVTLPLQHGTGNGAPKQSRLGKEF